MNEAKKTLAQFIELCKKNKSSTVLAVLVLILLVILMKQTGAAGSPGESVPGTEETQEEIKETEAAEAYQKDAYPAINELIGKYYKAYANGKLKKLAKLAEPISDAEKSYISVFSEYVTGYENISCYTKRGLEEGSYIVSVYMEVRFKDMETVMPGVETCYIRTREDGSLYIDNAYGTFNSQRKEFPVDERMAEFIDQFALQDDVVALTTEAQKKYDDALAADEKLEKMANNILPAAIEVWANEQEAAVRKAEEEKAAAEEKAKKEKEEEERRAAELASAVTVYATDKVNVRASASETADILGKLEIGSQTTRLEDKDGWSRIDYSEGTYGYVKSDYLSTEKPAVQEAPAEGTQSAGEGLAEGTVVLLKESVNVRKDMGSDSKKLATAFAGEEVTVILSYAEGWTKVSYKGKTGFIKTELLK